MMPSITRVIASLAGFAILGCSAAAGTGPGSSGSATYKGAIYSTSLGSAGTGCVYTGAASGSLTIGPVQSVSGLLDGVQSDTMSVSFVLKSYQYAGLCNLHAYIATRTNNAITGTYSNLTALGGDGFTNWNFTGALVGNALVGTLTITVDAYDGTTGSVTTFPPVVIKNYTLTQQ